MILIETVSIFVMAGLVPAIHVLGQANSDPIFPGRTEHEYPAKAWMAGTSPAMTPENNASIAPC